MRKNLRMTYIKYENKKGYMGHWKMSYYVDNVIDLTTNEIITSEYVFKESKIFKGMGLKLGDIVEMSATVTEKNGKIRISYYSDVKKVVLDE